MPVAFLSHSSQDKQKYVAIVASRLEKHCRVYDDDTFEAGMKTLDEILRGLAVTDLFVLFISNASLDSDWVKKEIRTAKRHEREGQLRRIFPIIIDEAITHRDPRIPAWIRDTYNLRPVRRPTVAVRQIQQKLRELSWQDHPRLAERRRIFVGRHDQIAAIEERFTDYDNPAPICVIASGLPSIGRRSVLMQAIRKATAVPRDSYEPAKILLTPLDSIEDFIIKVYDLGFSAPMSFDGMLEKDLAEKQRIARLLCVDIHSANEILLIEDNGCIVSYERRIAVWFRDLINSLNPSQGLLFASASRFRPDFAEYKNTPFFHLPVPELSPRERTGLFKRLADFDGLNLKPDDYEYFKDILSGFPEQIQYAVSLIKDEGLHHAKAHTELLVQFNKDKASALVDSTIQNNDELSLLMLLSEFEFISYDLLSEFTDLTKVGPSLERFFGAALCERLGSTQEYIRVNDAIRDHLKRQRLVFPEKYKTALIEHAKRFIADYKSEEVDASDYLFSLQRALLEGVNVPTKILVPSHFLKAMKDLYDRHRNYKDVIRLADQVLHSSANLDDNIQRELRYYLCLSLARLRQRRFTEEVQRISGPEHNFLFGFYYRMMGQLDRAIERQQNALKETRTASRARRELVQLYVMLEDYESALSLAERAHDERPGNPFHTEALIKCLINLEDWKSQEGRIRELIKSLGDSKLDRAKEMHLTVNAYFHTICLKDYSAALKLVDKAIDEFPRNVYPLFAKLVILFRQRDVSGVNVTIKQLEQLIKPDSQFHDSLVKMKAQQLALAGKLKEANMLIDSRLKYITPEAKQTLQRRVEQLSVAGVLPDEDQAGE